MKLAGLSCARKCGHDTADGCLVHAGHQSLLRARQHLLVLEERHHHEFHGRRSMPAPKELSATVGAASSSSSRPSARTSRPSTAAQSPSYGPGPRMRSSRASGRGACELPTENTSACEHSREQQRAVRGASERQVRPNSSRPRGGSFQRPVDLDRPDAAALLRYAAQQDSCVTSLVKVCAQSFNPSTIVRYGKSWPARSTTVMR